MALADLVGALECGESPAPPPPGGLSVTRPAEYTRDVSRGGVITFGDFRLDRVDGRLWQGEVERPLRGKSFSLLRHLAEHSGRLVTRDELLRAVWPGTAVTAGVVRTSI